MNKWEKIGWTLVAILALIAYSEFIRNVLALTE